MTQQLTVTQKITNYRQSRRATSGDRVLVNKPQWDSACGLSTCTAMPLSASFNASHPFHPSSLSFVDFLLQRCLKSTVSVFITTIATIISILLLLPVCVFVLHLGYGRWRQQHSGMKMSHSDLFTYNMVFIELVSIIGSISILCGVYADLPGMALLGICLIATHYTGQISFHVLTCVERYLAVLHPVTYLSLRRAKAIRVRNLIIVCVWLHSVLAIGYTFAPQNVFMSVIYSTLPSSICIICFCSVSVLCALIRPGPGEGGGDRQRVDQSKLRAFYTILSIMGVLLLRFGVILVISYMYDSMGETERCGLWMSGICFTLPSSLILPLLFLHRAGKLPCWKNSSNPGAGSHQSNP